MERKIGETFEFEGDTYRVEESYSGSCTGCAFQDRKDGCPKDVSGICCDSSRHDNNCVVFTKVRKKQSAVEEVLRLMPSEKTEIPSDLYKRLVYLGIIDPTGTRDSNVGNSDYSKHLIQPWAIWLDYPELTPWDDDIIKRILRTKEEAGMTPTQARIMDYNKIIHICKERIRQLELEK